MKSFAEIAAMFRRHQEKHTQYSADLKRHLDRLHGCYVLRTGSIGLSPSRKEWESRAFREAVIRTLVDLSNIAFRRPENWSAPIPISEARKVDPQVEEAMQKLERGEIHLS